jgi:hypothetical protein
MSTIYSDPHAGASILKSVFGLFGNFGFNKAVANINNVRTVFSKGSIVDENGNSVKLTSEQLNDERNNAIKSLIGGIAEEVMFNGIKAFVIKLTLYPALYALFASQEDDPKKRERIVKESKRLREKAFDNFVANSASNYFFSFAGQQGQQMMNETSNTLKKFLFGGDNIFYETKQNPNIKTNEGLAGAAFGDIKNDLMRMARITFNNKGTTTDEFTWGGIALFSDLLGVMKFGDADINRAIHKRMQWIDEDLRDRYGDPRWVDLNALKNASRQLSLKKFGKIKPTDEQWDYYTNTRDSKINELNADKSKAKWSKEKKTRTASDFAKGELEKKFGRNFTPAPPEE